MKNFNTNQTRFLYVAGAIDANVNTKLDIALGAVESGEMFFKYRNSDDLVVRSDSFDPKKIVSLKKTLGSDLATSLKRHKITLDTTVIALDGSSHLDDYFGSTFSLIVKAHQMVSFDDSDVVNVIAQVPIVKGMAVADFNKNLAILLAKNLQHSNYKNFKVYAVNSTTFTEITDTIADKYIVSANGTVSLKTGASDATSYATGIAIYEIPQKFVVGKLSADPMPLSVEFSIHGSEVENVAWGKEEVDASGSTLSGTYALAELEYFAAGEKGDYVRGSVWPNDYQFNPAITDFTKVYDVLSIEYYWAGDAENVQKSPRLIQVAAEHNASAASDICTILYEQIDAAMHGAASSI